IADLGGILSLSPELRQKITGLMGNELQSAGKITPDMQNISADFIYQMYRKWSAFDAAQLSANKRLAELEAAGKNIPPTATVLDVAKEYDILQKERAQAKLAAQSLQQGMQVNAPVVVLRNLSQTGNFGASGQHETISPAEQAKLKAQKEALQKQEEIDKMLQFVSEKAPIGMNVAGLLNFMSGDMIGDFTDYFVHDKFKPDVQILTKERAQYSFGHINNAASAITQNEFRAKYRSAPAWEFVGISPVQDKYKKNVKYGDISPTSTEPQLTDQEACQLSYTAFCLDNSSPYKAGGRSGQTLTVSVILPRSMGESLYQQIKSNPLLVREIAKTVFTQCIEDQKRNVRNTEKEEMRNIGWKSTDPLREYRPPYERWAAALGGKPKMAFCDANQDPRNDIKQIAATLVDIPT
ncbi:MAG: hypothetical protein WCH01_23445, partial [Methylococcaceae bacterium]